MMPAERDASAPANVAPLLDPQSRRTARGFLTRASIYAAFAAGPWLLGVRPPADVGVRLVALFALGGSFAMVLAVLQGDRAGRGPLNRWDEALAFNGLSLLTHVAGSLF